MNNTILHRQRHPDAHKGYITGAVKIKPIRVYCPVYKYKEGK